MHPNLSDSSCPHCYVSSAVLTSLEFRRAPAAVYVRRADEWARSRSTYFLVFVFSSATRARSTFSVQFERYSRSLDHNAVLSTSSDLYKALIMSSANFGSTHPRSSATTNGANPFIGYVKIGVVGRGAYGICCAYKKPRDDDGPPRKVIIKSVPLEGLRSDAKEKVEG